MPTRQEVLNKISLLEQQGFKKEAELYRLQHKHIIKPDVPHGAQAYLDRFITRDKDMLTVKHHTGLLANHQDNVLIHGPTGTGKEILARALHGDRTIDNKGEWIEINCAALPSNLIESELFGHAKGAFTGAVVAKEGMFQSAQGGTVFLDEVGELPLDIQAKLLRVIQERVVRKVGSNQNESFNARIVCATLKNLEERVRLGLFREDLYYRINTFTLQLTPLVERPGDVPIITEYVADKYERELGIDPEKKFPRNTQLNPVDLTGNVRSIEQIIRRYHVLGVLPV